MVVLSLFDGISCGQLALKEAGIQVDRYFASEINNQAMLITNHNFPNTIQLGDITKWKDWNINWGEIDLVIGGSPCQGFSFRGLQLNFDDPRSKLFFEFCDILEEVKKHNKEVYFFLENVRMKKEFEKVITDKMGVEPITINSKLLSAQSRTRLYWTNIPNITIPEDLHITLDDIIDENAPMEITFEEMFKRGPRERYYYVGKQLKAFYDKKGYYPKYFNPYNAAELKEKSVCLTAHCGQLGTTAGVVVVKDNQVRNITIEELERLQTLPTGYTNVDGVCATQRKMAIGNGWTVSVIAHCFKNLKEKE